MEHIEFNEAIEILAKKANVTITKQYAKKGVKIVIL